ncbi:DUF5129 domain-containing protein [Arthrobacter sp. I2-34]|uniref:DUF5129 domain-containing protein n=1 Tax=Arthrobacter hankyongi TaxID=2904801 RepID=A0ABS9L3Q2_9MICC|nr:DUF5129 domain-containing protein [Arthrobacter hankyongi]MCG2621266.1 DUF5129 domain-containing protein [Arthrobacter hankyongi]
MRRVLGSLLLALAALLGPAPAALAETPTDIVVEDNAGVLDRKTLLPAVESIDFYEPTKVAVYTYRGSRSDNLNEQVLRFARAEHPEWISADGQKWADGLFIFALDPVGRHVGTYLGEDRKVSTEAQQDIQDAAKDLFRDAQWTDGTIAGIQRGAELINRPWYRSGFFIGSLWVAGVAAVAGLGSWLAVRRRNQVRGLRERERGDRSYANVTMDLDATEVNARVIPTTSKYGALVLERYRTFMTAYSAASKLNGQVHAMSNRALAAGRNVKVVRQYADAAAELDALDDVIADTNALLNRAAGWAKAWDRQVAPLRADLDGIGELLDKPEARGNSATAAALLSFRDTTRRQLDEWAAGLGAGSLAPDAALDQLEQARRDFNDLLRNHSQTVIEGYAKTQKEAELMRKDMDDSLQGSRGPRSTILDTAYPSYAFYSIVAFNSGFSSAQGSVDSSRSDASTTGYGSSGGSFSGSGSSSSF